MIEYHESECVVIEEHPIALQLRYLQTLLEIGSTNASTIVFPAPIDLIKPFLDSAGKQPERSLRSES